MAGPDGESAPGGAAGYRTGLRRRGGRADRRADRLRRAGAPSRRGRLSMSGRPMSTRGASIERFLAGNGWEGCRRDPLPVDCSFRRYERLHFAEGRAALLMAAPPPPEDVRPFVQIRRHLISE